MYHFKNEETRKRAIEKLELGRSSSTKRSIILINKYNKNPKKCKQCKNSIEYVKRINIFCSSRCSAIYNNENKKIGRKIIILKEIKCKTCLKIFKPKSLSTKYCSMKCFNENQRKESFKKYEKGVLSDEGARRFFRIITDKKCSICGLDRWMNKEIPLEVDHIDGNPKNNFPKNLRFVCCNCAAQLPTYKGANKGNGRKERRKNAKK